jgi:molybdopterin molybdotransferase
MHPASSPLISVAEAEARLMALVTPPGPQRAEVVPLAQALGRVLATPLTAPQPIPPWDNAAMDGYALRAAAVSQASPDQPARLTLGEVIAAGAVPQQPLAPGQAARLFTGSMLPPGADTVVMQEVTRVVGNQVEIFTPPPLGQFVRRRGSFYQPGSPLLPAGLAISAPELALLASAQWAQVPVLPRPRVAILSTGNELVEVGSPLQPGQIVDANQPALVALVQGAGAVPLPLGRVPDQATALESAIATALPQADMILSSGGVSVGDFDYVDSVLRELGATLWITAVAVKPGKPLTVATLPRPDGAPPLLYLGLPGNPVSALVCFWRFVEPALRKQAGLSRGWSPQWVWATPDQPLTAGGDRETYLWGHLSPGEEGYRFNLAPGSHNSANLVNLAGSNALAVVPVGTTHIPGQTRVRVMVVGRITP